MKLKSNRGATLLISILMFMVAALSGTIALTMAASNAGRYSHEKEDQQVYLAVSSAANLILDELKGLTMRVEIGYEKTDNVKTYHNPTVNYLRNGASTTSWLSSAQLNFEWWYKYLVVKSVLKENDKADWITDNQDEIDNKAKGNKFRLSLSSGDMGSVEVGLSFFNTKLQFEIYYNGTSSENYQMILAVDVVGSNVTAKTESSGKIYDDITWDTAKATISSAV